MLKDGGIYFEGNYTALRGTSDPYLRKFMA